MRYWLPYVRSEHDDGIVGSMPDERQNALIEEYRRYFDTIKASLPPDLLLIGDRKNEINPLYLNDGEVRGIETDFASRCVTIVIEGDAYDLRLSRAVGSRLFTLRYREVDGWDYKGKGYGPADLDGDHLFDEIQRLPDGLIQHRMYFSGEIEIAVRFRDFSIGYTDVLHDSDPAAYP